MTTEEKIDRLTGIVESLAASVVARDNQLDALTNITRELSVTTRGLLAITENQGKQIASLERQWQAYINTLPRS